MGLSTKGTGNQKEDTEMKEITIKKVSTNEQLISKRTIKYDIYEDGEYTCTFDDINDALDYQRERMDETTEETIQSALMEMWAGDPERFVDLIRGMRTYEDAGIPIDKGVLITTADGSQFQLTIKQSRWGW